MNQITFADRLKRYNVVSGDIYMSRDTVAMVVRIQQNWSLIDLRDGCGIWINGTADELFEFLENSGYERVMAITVQAV